MRPVRWGNIASRRGHDFMFSARWSRLVMMDWSQWKLRGSMTLAPVSCGVAELGV